MNCWVIVPAAGAGQRFGAELPKQYQPVMGKTVLEWTLERLLAADPRGLVVAHAPEDQRWRQLPVMGDPRVRTVTGGASRAESVQQALDALTGQVDEQQWLMVHDAARPCVRVADIRQLYNTLQTHPVGGILAAPVSDTIKRVADASIHQTVDREGLWSALTPQMFRFGLLRDALLAGVAAGVQITDEASAVEAAGYAPAVVEGNADNIKITRREDLPVAEAVIRHQLATEGRQA